MQSINNEPINQTQQTTNRSFSGSSIPFYVPFSQINPVLLNSTLCLLSQINPVLLFHILSPFFIKSIGSIYSTLYLSPFLKSIQSFLIPVSVSFSEKKSGPSIPVDVFFLNSFLSYSSFCLLFSNQFGPSIPLSSSFSQINYL